VRPVDQPLAVPRKAPRGEDWKSPRAGGIPLPLVFLLLVLLSCSTSPGDQVPDDRNFSRIQVFQAWGEIENREDLDYWERMALHDLVFHEVYNLSHAYWDPTQGDEPPYEGLITHLNPTSLLEAKENRRKLLDLNPDLLQLAALLYREGALIPPSREGEEWWQKGFLPPDSPLWLTDSKGAPIIGWGEDTNKNGQIDGEDEILTYLIDFTYPEFQNLVAQKAAALYRSGLFEGIFLDWMSSEATTDDASVPGWSPVLSSQQELQGRLSLIQKIRKATGEDFLIMGNTNDKIHPELIPYLNAVFMECYKPDFTRGYTREELGKIQEALVYNQTHLAEPALVCLEGWRVARAYLPDLETRVAEREEEENLRWVRFFTTMSLTLSDGYVLFSDDNALPLQDHLHNWYDFWDAPLGEPEERYLPLKEEPPLYQREFENGWAVHNFCQDSRVISFSHPVYSVAQKKVARTFAVDSLDGDIFLKEW